MKYNDTITLWKTVGLDMYGNKSYYTPVQHKVRWEQQERLITDSDGREIQGQAVVYFMDDVFDIGDFVVLGVFLDSTPTKGSYDIKNKRVISNLSGTEFEYRALL